MNRVGLLSITHRNLSADEIIELAVEAGIDGIEWGGDIHVPHGNLAEAERVGIATRAKGLKIPSFGSYYRCGHSDEAGLPFRSVLDTAVALQAPAIRVWAGTANFQDTDVARRAIIIEDLRCICNMAAEKGIEIVLEYHAGTLNNSPEGNQFIFSQVHASNLKTLWQTTNGADDDYILGTIHRVKEHIRHVHVFNWKTGFDDQTLLASGASRWNTFLDALCSFPGERFFCLEFVKDGNPEHTRQDAKTLRMLLNGKRAK